MDKQELITRGQRAEVALRDEVWVGAFKELEADFLKVWGSTTDGETAGREKLWTATQILGDVLKLLQRRVRDGKIAQQDIERMAGLNRAA